MKHLRVIKANYSGSTSTITLTERRYSKYYRTKIPYNHKYQSMKDQLEDYFKEVGISMVGYGWLGSTLLLFSDTWGDNFVDIRGKKAYP
jgi:hypothetical protein